MDPGDTAEAGEDVRGVAEEAQSAQNRYLASDDVDDDSGRHESRKRQRRL
jgi:hypothetical protein